MAGVNRNMFDASVTAHPPGPRGALVMVLPLNLIALIISYLDNAADLARVCRTCRVLSYMALPQLYKNLTLTSYDKIRYRDDQPEGWGSASPFSMGLNAVVTRPHAALVRAMTLRGEWREHELEEHARVGRVPDSSMMLNIAVRAAIDRMSELESFSWELNTKMLETVYQSLAQRPKLTSLTIRFPSSRHPRPTTVIPPMPHLRSLKVTDIDPLCYPDDLSTLFLRSKKLQELKMHWSSRMREAQEPSVMLHDYFRKCIAAKSPLKVKKLSLQNLYAIHTEEFNTAFDHNFVEEVTMLNSPGMDEQTFMNTFVDNSWPSHPPNHRLRIKAMRHDCLSKKHCDFLAACSGMERLYFVNAIRDPSDYINTPRQSAGPSTALTPPSLEQTSSSPNGIMAAGVGAASPSSPHSPASASSAHILLRESYLNTILSRHGSTLRHLLLPSRWCLSSSAIARIVRGCPNLEQFALAPEVSSFETLALLLPFLRKLIAIRLLIPTGPQSSQSLNSVSRPARSVSGTSSGCRSNGANGSNIPILSRTLAEIVDMDDRLHNEMIGMVLADKETFSNLRVLGLGWKAWELGEFYTIPAEGAQNFSEMFLRNVNIAGTGQTSQATCRDSSGQAAASPADGAGPNSRPEPSITPSTPTPFAKSPIPRPGRLTVPSPQSSLGKHPRDTDGPASLHQQKRLSAVREAGSFDRHPDTSGTENGSGEKVLWRRRARRVGWEVLQRWEIWSLDMQDM